jgi:hypothetical protein
MVKNLLYSYLVFEKIFIYFFKIYYISYKSHKQYQIFKKCGTIEQTKFKYSIGESVIVKRSSFISETNIVPFFGIMIVSKAILCIY